MIKKTRPIGRPFYNPDNLENLTAVLRAALDIAQTCHELWAYFTGSIQQSTVPMYAASYDDQRFQRLFALLH